MATTTAAITITSTDLTTDSLSLSTTATLTKAATANGLEQVIGVSRQTIASAGETTLLSASSYTADKAHKLYVKNTSTTDAHNIILKIGTQIIGRLYAGDFMLIPWCAASDENDIFVKPSVSTNMVIEYMVFYE